jgi:Aldo/keto reductase family
VAREDVFVGTKLWNTNHRPERVGPAFDASLRRLRLDYLDCYLIHTPFAFQPGDDQDPRDEHGDVIYDPDVTLAETWQALERLVDDGRCRSIGLSDVTLEKVREIVGAHGSSPPWCRLNRIPTSRSGNCSNSVRSRASSCWRSPAGAFAEPKCVDGPGDHCRCGPDAHVTGPSRAVVGRATWHRVSDDLDETATHRGELSDRRPPDDAMRAIREDITENVRFNAVVHSGVPGFIPKA